MNLSSRDLAGQIKIYQSQTLERFSLDKLEYEANLHQNYTNDKQAHHETISRMGNEQTQACVYARTHHYSYLMSQGRPIQDHLQLQQEVGIATSGRYLFLMQEDGETRRVHRASPK